jgi:hypothetical protein
MYLCFFPDAGKQHFYAFTNCLHCSGDFKYLLCIADVMTPQAKFSAVLAVNYL